MLFKSQSRERFRKECCTPTSQMHAQCNLKPRLQEKKSSLDWKNVTWSFVDCVVLWQVYFSSKALTIDINNIQPLQRFREMINYRQKLTHRGAGTTTVALRVQRSTDRASRALWSVLDAPDCFYTHFTSCCIEQLSQALLQCTKHIAFKQEDFRYLL